MLDHWGGGAGALLCGWVLLPLHASLLRNLGVSLAEIIWLDVLADACAADGRWDFLYTAAPLKIHEATGSPVNPVVIR